MIRGPRRAPWALCLLLLCQLGSSGCLPHEARQLNTSGDRAMSDRRYEQAISAYSRSLAMAPGQEEIVHRLASAKVLLRQIYVDRIYDLVDARVGATTSAGFVKAWELSARLPDVDVTAARVASIRQDLNKRFIKAEPLLRKATEHHRYHLDLTRMQALVADRAVAAALVQVSNLLRAHHVKSRDRANKARRKGLALLHCAAAATFSQRDTGLWNETRGRREALLARLAIPLQLAVTVARGSANRYLGGLRRRLPSIFSVQPRGKLVLLLEVRDPASEQTESRSRHNADCKVGTRREENPACPSLKRRVEQGARDLQSSRGALDAAAERCAREQNASSCNSYISDAQRRLQREKDDYRRLESEASACPRTVERPVFKTFFYERRTVQRHAMASATLSLTRGGEAITSRAVQGAASASDSHGGGLACAGVASDPLRIPSLSSLLATAEERLLDGCTSELRRLQREKATAQLAGSDEEAARLDSLVRARLVDPTYKEPAALLARHLKANWGSDFGLTDLILK